MTIRRWRTKIPGMTKSREKSTRPGLVNTRVKLRNVNLVRCVNFRIDATKLKRWYDRLKYGPAHVVEWLHLIFCNLVTRVRTQGKHSSSDTSAEYSGCHLCILFQLKFNSQTNIFSKTYNETFWRFGETFRMVGFDIRKSQKVPQLSESVTNVRNAPNRGLGPGNIGFDV